MKIGHRGADRAAGIGATWPICSAPSARRLRPPRCFPAPGGKSKQGRPVWEDWTSWRRPHSGRRRHMANLLCAFSEASAASALKSPGVRRGVGSVQRGSDAAVVVGEDGVDAHGAVAARLVRVVRPEDIASDVVFMGLVDHLLVEVGLEELDLLRAEFDGAVDDRPGALGVVADAEADFGRGGLEAARDGVVGDHEVGVACAVILAEEGDDAVDRGLVVVVGERLDVDVHDHLPRELAEDVLEGDDAEAGEAFAELRAEVEFAQLGEGVFVDLARAVADAVEGGVVAGDDFAVGRRPEVELDFLGAHRDGGAEGGHAVFGGDGAEAAVGAEARVGEAGVVADHGGSAVAVLPGVAAELDVLVVRGGRVAVAGGLEVLRGGVEGGGGLAEGAAHVGEDLAVGRHDHACAADRRVLRVAHRGADDVGVRVVGDVAAHDLGGVVGVAPLEGAADDDVDLLAGDARDGLVEVEVVAGEEAVADAVHLQHVGRGGFEGVGRVELEDVELEGRQVLLEVLAGELAVAVVAVGRVAPARRLLREGVHEDVGAAAARRRGAGLEEDGDVAVVEAERVLERLRRAGDVAVLGEDDEVDGRVAGAELLQLEVEETVGVGRVV